MQYILTQEEYGELKSTHLTQRDAFLVKLQTFCTLVADTMPVKWGWGEPDIPRPWGCIITRKNSGEWYCDQCPVQE